MEIGENFMPLSQGFLDRIKPADRFLLAFPRSGSRWLCYLITDLVNQWQGLDSTYLYRRLKARRGIGPPLREKTGLSVIETVPDAHNTDSVDLSVLDKLSGAAVYRSHHLAEVLRRSEGVKIYIARHPAAVILSYHMVAQELGWVAPGVTLEEFTSWKLEPWVDHVQTMLAYRKLHPSKCLFLTYQDDVPLTAAQLEALAMALEIPFTSEGIRAALVRLLEYLEHLNSDAQALGLRGSNAKSLAHLPPALLERIDATAAPLLAEVSRAEAEDMTFSWSRTR